MSPTMCVFVSSVLVWGFGCFAMAMFLADNNGWGGPDNEEILGLAPRKKFAFVTLWPIWLPAYAVWRLFRLIVMGR